MDVKELAIRLAFEHYEGIFCGIMESKGYKRRSAPMESRKQAEDNWEQWKDKAETIIASITKDL